MVRNQRKRRPEHPRTPDAYEKMSKRDFEGRIKAWRRALHLWDNVDDRPDSNPHISSKNPFASASDVVSSSVGKKRKASDSPQRDDSTHKNSSSSNEKRFKNPLQDFKDPKKVLCNELEPETAGKSLDNKYLIGEESQDNYKSDHAEDNFDDEDVL